MSPLHTMRLSLPPWGAPLDIAVVTGDVIDAEDIRELDLIRRDWQACGGGVLRGFTTFDQALDAVTESAHDWVSRIAADSGLPAENPLGLVAVLAEKAPSDGGGHAPPGTDSPVSGFLRQLARLPVVRALIGGDELTPTDLEFFDTGLIDMRLPLNSATHTQDPTAWRVLADETRNLVFNRMSASVPGIWGARPPWLTDIEQGRKVAELLRERGICSWEWITGPHRLRCVNRTGEVSWLYVQSAGERPTPATGNARPVRKDGNVIHITASPSAPPATDTPRMILGSAHAPRIVEAERLVPEASTCFLWTDSEL
ncbi:MAG: hypothetical protein ACPGUC_09710 [Gammaproteobacteria bacterium]